jgi:hypothetical protein
MSFTDLRGHGTTERLIPAGTDRERRVDKNTTVVFPAPLMSTIQELGGFLARETTAATTPTPAPPPPAVPLAPAKVPAGDAGSNGAPPATPRD